MVHLNSPPVWSEPNTEELDEMHAQNQYENVVMKTRRRSYTYTVGEPKAGGGAVSGSARPAPPAREDLDVIPETEQHDLPEAQPFTDDDYDDGHDGGMGVGHRGAPSPARPLENPGGRAPPRVRERAAAEVREGENRTNVDHGEQLSASGGSFVWGKNEEYWSRLHMVAEAVKEAKATTTAMAIRSRPGRRW